MPRSEIHVKTLHELCVAQTLLVLVVDVLPNKSSLIVVSFGDMQFDLDNTALSLPEDLKELQLSFMSKRTSFMCSLAGGN